VLGEGISARPGAREIAEEAMWQVTTDGEGFRNLLLNTKEAMPAAVLRAGVELSQVLPG